MNVSPSNAALHKPVGLFLLGRVTEARAMIERELADIDERQGPWFDLDRTSGPDALRAMQSNLQAE